MGGRGRREQEEEEEEGEGIYIFFKKKNLGEGKEFWNMMTMEGMMDRGVLDDIIRRLLEGKGGKQVQLSEGEIRQLCVNARQIFLSQPNLLELSAPIRICGILFLPFFILSFSGL